MQWSLIGLLDDYVQEENTVAHVLMTVVSAFACPTVGLHASGLEWVLSLEPIRTITPAEVTKHFSLDDWRQFLSHFGRRFFNDFLSQHQVFFGKALAAGTPSDSAPTSHGQAVALYK